MSALGITLPLRIRQAAEAFAIEDSAGRSIGYVSFCDEQRRGVMKRVSMADARRIAQVTPTGRMDPIKIFQSGHCKMWSFTQPGPVPFSEEVRVVEFGLEPS